MRGSFQRGLPGDRKTGLGEILVEVTMGKGATDYGASCYRLKAFEGGSPGEGCSVPLAALAAARLAALAASALAAAAATTLAPTFLGSR